MNTGEAIFMLAEGYENLLAVLGDGLLISGLGTFVVRAIAATGEDGQGDARTDGPDTAFPIEEIIDIGADKAAGSSKPQDGEESSFGDADPRVGGGELAFGVGNIGTALKEVSRQAGGDGRRLRIPIRVGASQGSEFEGGRVGTDKDSKGVLEFGAALSERGSFRFGGSQFGFGAGDIEFVADAAFETAPNETDLLVAQADGAGN